MIECLFNPKFFIPLERQEGQVNISDFKYSNFYITTYFKLHYYILQSVALVLPIRGGCVNAYENELLSDLKETTGNVLPFLKREEECVRWAGKSEKIVRDKPEK